MICFARTPRWNILVIVQPAQIQDQNVDGIAFFASLQSGVSFVAKGNRRDLLEAIVECLGGLSWRENAKKCEACGCAYTTLFHGIMEVVGATENSRHRFVHSCRDEEDVAKVQRRIISADDKNLNEMRAEAATVGDAESASTSSGDNDTSDEDSEKTQSHSSELLFLCIYLVNRLDNATSVIPSQTEQFQSCAQLSKKVTKFLYTEEVQGGIIVL